MSTQKLWLLSMDTRDGETVEFPVIAGERDEAADLFRDHVVGSFFFEDEIDAAEDIGEPLTVTATRLFDTGQPAGETPSRVIAWEETAIEAFPLPRARQDDPEPGL